MPELCFRIDGKMARLLGEQSVSSNVAAIFELVKNGYDADASIVEVIFVGFIDKNAKLNIVKIKIRDDGIGMTFEDFRDRWMIVGTDIKERETRSPIYKRRVVGEKGIGRFATQRIGNRITITSDPQMDRQLISNRVTNYDNKRVVLHLDWKRYQAGTTFDEIRHKSEIIEKPFKEAHGTEILIEDLHDEWTKEDVEKIRERLSVLVLPKEISYDSKHHFNAKIITEGFNLPNIEIESNLFKKAPYSITAKLRGNSIIYTIYEEGQSVDRKALDEPIPVQQGLSCGDAEFKLYVYPQDRRDLTDKHWQHYYNKYIGADHFNEILRSYCGVKIYNDNVRVLPYGEPGNDWLALNIRQLGKYGEGKINNKSVIGFVLLTREKNSRIQETTTREGLIDNQEFRSWVSSHNGHPCRPTANAVVDIVTAIILDIMTAARTAINIIDMFFDMLLVRV